MNDRVILVDELDNEIGVCEKLAAHRRGLLHRAISIFVFSSRGEILLQKRARQKYHSGGLWSNTCCSHPRPGESIEAAAHRRLKEEMGFDCPLEKVHSFVYRVEFENELVEHEFDHVLVGVYDGVPVVNPNEAENWKWEAVDVVLEHMRVNPECYTYWFTLSFSDVVHALRDAKDIPIHTFPKKYL